MAGSSSLLPQRYRNRAAVSWLPSSLLWRFVSEVGYNKQEFDEGIKPCSEPAMNIDQFATLMVDSGLSNKPESEKLLLGFREECSRLNCSESLQGFSDYLVATGLFTAYQCEKL